MAFIPEVPINAQTPGPAVTKALNVFHIHRLDIALDPNDDAKVGITVRWSKGYTENNVYIPVQYTNTLLSGADVNAAIAAIPDGQKSIYGEVKAAVWALLQARQLIAQGAIS